MFHPRTPPSTSPVAGEPSALAPASVRTQVEVPLRFADGYHTTARVFTFDGLADGVASVAVGGPGGGADPSGAGDPGSGADLSEADGRRGGADPSGADGLGGGGRGGGREHLALGLGDWRRALTRGAAGGTPPLVRPHSECLTGDVFGSERCDCGPQLREAVERIAAAGGFLLYLRQEGRGIGLYAKLDAYALQDAGLDTYEANVALGHGEDERDYTAAAQMLRALGAHRVRLLTNNPDKATQLEQLGVTVTECLPTGVHLSPANGRYLAAKATRTGHTIALPLARDPGVPHSARS